MTDEEENSESRVFNWKWYPGLGRYLTPYGEVILGESMVVGWMAKNMVEFKDDILVPKPELVSLFKHCAGVRSEGETLALLEEPLDIDENGEPIVGYSPYGMSTISPEVIAVVQRMLATEKNMTAFMRTFGDQLTKEEKDAMAIPVVQISEEEMAELEKLGKEAGEPGGSIPFRDIVKRIQSQTGDDQDVRSM